MSFISRCSHNLLLIKCSQRYEETDYAVSDLNLAAGGDVANSDSKVDILMARSRNPSLSLHGIAGAFSGAGAKTVIPATVSGKFSLRYVVFCHTGTSM